MQRNVRNRLQTSAPASEFVAQDGQEIDAYTVRLNREFIVHKCLTECSREMPSLSNLENPLESMPIPDLTRWLVANGDYLSPAQIHRREAFAIGRVIARRMSMQCAMHDTSLRSLLSYWLELTKIKHRPFRCAATMILFSSVYEALKLIAYYSLSPAEQVLLQGLQFVWVNGLLRACNDVDIYIRVFALKMTGMCCTYFPDRLWDTNVARLFLQGACARAKTVRAATFAQLVELSLSREVSFADIRVADLWINTLALYASEPSRQPPKSQSPVLDALLALSERPDFTASSPGAFQSLLIQSVKEGRPIAAIVMTLKLFLANARDNNAFERAVAILIEHGKGRLDALGEALGLAEPTHSVAYFTACIHHGDIDRSLTSAFMRLLCGTVKSLDENEVLTLVEVFKTTYESERTTSYYSMKLLQCVKNRRQDKYLDILRQIMHVELMRHRISELEMLQSF